jgi:hypothetical protein
MSQFERANIKFCQKLGKSPSEAFNIMKQVYGEEALSHSAVFKWHQCFVQGRDSLEDDEQWSENRCESRMQDERLCNVGMCHKFSLMT